MLPGLAMLYLAAKPPQVGADVDRASLSPALSCHLLMADLGQSPLTDIVLLYLVTKLLLKVSPPTPVHILLLSGKGTESSGRRRPI
jgi:hypothetical protein